MRAAFVLGSLLACGTDVAPTDPAPDAPRAALTLAPPAHDFGDSDFTEPSLRTQSFTLANDGDRDLAVSGFAIVGPADFAIANEGCPDVLVPGASCGITVQFQAAARDRRSATLEVMADGAAATAALAGRGISPIAIIVSPDARHFGDITAGTTSELVTFTVLNELADTTIAPSIAGAGAGAFAIASTTCSGVLALHASCTIEVALSPAHGGEFVADLAIAGDVRAGLMGQSTSPLSARPFTRMFGSMLLGEIGATETIAIENTTTEPTGTLTAQLVGAAAADFTIRDSTCTTLAPAETCTVTVQLTAQSRGAKTAALEITDGATNLATRATLRGDAYGLLLAGAPAFPATAVGQTSTKIFEILNASSSATGAVTTQLTGAGFAVTRNTCTTGVAANQSCDIEIQFTPASPGAKSATLSVSSSPGGSDVLEITGSGT